MISIVFPSHWDWNQIGDWLESRDCDGYWDSPIEHCPVWVWTDAVTAHFHFHLGGAA